MLKKYGYPNATKTIKKKASWSEIKASIDNTYNTRNVSSTAVYSTPSVAIVYLDDSQIYNDHFTIGTGYITFDHSSGWRSRYVQIFDQKSESLKYVNYSLGIGYITVLEIRAESGVTAPPVPTPAMNGGK